MPIVGILSLQGDFARHRAALEALGMDVREVRRPADLEGLDALVIPGGESTTMTKLMAAAPEGARLRERLERFVREEPVLGTCAGLILLAREVEGFAASPLGVLDVRVERNAYGRQIDSFHADLDAPALGSRFPGVFIRAPRLTRVGAGVEVVARRAPEERSGDGEPVGVRAGRVVGLCFHPELTPDLGFHRWFLRDVAGLALPREPARMETAGRAR